MTTRAALKNKTKKPLETTLGKAPTNGNEQIDLSHIGKTIHTSLFGLRQVLALFETATEEVQAYITYECDIMYECRICRTIFRSLANFILHKRNYCQELYKKTKNSNFYEQFSGTELFIINNENASEESNPVKKDEDKVPINIEPKTKKSDENITSTKSKRTLSTILPRLINKQENTLLTEECLAEDNSNETKCSNEENKPNIALQDMNESCVFQTMYDTKDTKLDFMKTEVMEIHDILENNEAIIGTNGKIVEPEGTKSNVLKNNFMCVVCNQKFSTKKTLTYHINYKHNVTRKVYQCTECADTFANTWGVFRHLYKVHRKTPAQVKKLRSQIHSNRIRNDEQVIIKNNEVKSDLKVGDNTQIALGSEDKQWIDDLECDNDLQRCGGCGRKFERKAALHSHSQFCTKRIAVCNSIKESTNKKVQEEKQEKKLAKLPEPIVITPPDGSRKRKPLVAYKILRFDYTKDVPINTTVNDNTEHQTRELVQSEERDTDEVDKTAEITHLNTIISDLVIDNTSSTSVSTQENSSDGNSIPLHDPTESVEMDVENNNSKCEAVNRKPPKDNNSLSVKKKGSRALEKKCMDYINKERKLCLPCDKVFKTYKCLMRHMAIHFNWHRYQCTTCEYTSYQRSKCEHHAEKKHSITDKVTLSTYITHIPFQKTINSSTDFINYAKKCKTEGGSEEVHINEEKGQSTEDEVIQDKFNIDENLTTMVGEIPNPQDPAVRDMIMKVIFGNDASTSTINCNPNTESNESVSNGNKEGSPSAEEEIAKEQSESELATTTGCDNNMETNTVEEQNPFEPTSTHICDDLDVKTSVANDRPIRTRTATVRKEFLYDMTQILKLKSAKNKESLTEPKPLRVYSRKNKPAQPKTNSNNLNGFEDVNMNNKPIQVPDT
ncbi:hypothetical protein RI129_001834 [Pyrocoelia pectoralis]|uniref:C2H2-type domain-containing protein n=1 Tax=Pyrocoelia pectoralis TaxID=417401 RepID=A0AAN7VP80_9COLE